MIGHLLGASGAVEAVATIQVMTSSLDTVLPWMNKQAEWTKQ